MSEFLDQSYFDDIKLNRRLNAVVSACYDDYADTLYRSSNTYRTSCSINSLVSDGSLVELLDPVWYGSLIPDVFDLTIPDDPDVIDCKRLLSKSRRLSNCANVWFFDSYNNQHIRDITEVRLCKDKFCYSCQSMLAYKRYQKYRPIFDDLADHYDMFHIVFTVPNCLPSMLTSTVDLMQKSFSYLVRYLDGRKLLSNIDLTKYGYCGCIRSLEITYNSDQGRFHPHFHCMFAFEKDHLPMLRSGYNINSFSFSNSNNDDPYIFSDFEILLQKIWYCLNNGIKVNKVALDHLGEGYSVKALYGTQYFHECTKYITKGIFKDGFFNNYDDNSRELFYNLQPCLDHRRVMQTYGCFRGRFDEDVSILEESFSEWYQDYLSKLRSVESPVATKSDFGHVYDSLPIWRYISKFSLKNDFLSKRQFDLLPEFDF